MSQAALVAARELFRQGTEDVDAGRFAEALEKFRRVSAVRESAAVRFNIAKCEESLDKTGTALADFELAEREARQDPQHGTDDVAKLARDHADALRAKVPRLGLVAPTPAPEGLTITLDGTRVGPATMGVPLPLDPGKHVVEASAPGRTAFRAEVALASGDSKTVTVVLPLPAPPPPPDTAGGVGAEGTPGSRGSSQRTWGWVTVGTGGALAAGSLVLLLMHNSTVRGILDACPDNHCPSNRMDAIDADQSRAKLEETLSIVSIAASGAALGVGALLILTAPKSHESPPAPAAFLAPGAPGAPAGLSLHATF